MFVAQDPSTFGKVDGSGVFASGTGLRGGSIPGANRGEAMAHELLGHAWGQMVMGQAPGSMANYGAALNAENAARATDPSRGFKTRHHGVRVLKDYWLLEYIFDGDQ